MDKKNFSERYEDHIESHRQKGFSPIITGVATFIGAELIKATISFFAFQGLKTWWNKGKNKDE